MALVFATIPQLILNPWIEQSFVPEKLIENYIHIGIALLLLIPFLFDIDVGIRSDSINTKEKNSGNFLFGFVPVLNFLLLSSRKTLSPQFKFYYALFHTIPIIICIGFVMMKTDQFITFDHDNSSDPKFTLYIFSALISCILVITYIQVLFYYVSRSIETAKISGIFSGILPVFNIIYLPDKHSFPRKPVYVFSASCALLYLSYLIMAMFSIDSSLTLTGLLIETDNYLVDKASLIKIRELVTRLALIYLLYIVTSYSIMNLTDSNKHRYTWWLSWVPILNLVLISGIKKVHVLTLVALVALMSVLSFNTYNWYRNNNGFVEEIRWQKIRSSQPSPSRQYSYSEYLDSTSENRTSTNQ